MNRPLALLSKFQLPTAVVLILAGVLDLVLELGLTTPELAAGLLAVAAALGVPRPSELCAMCQS